MSPKPPVGKPETARNKWIERVSQFVEPTFESVKIGTEEVKFYPISMRMLFKLKPVAKPIFGALSDLIVAHEKTTGVTQRDVSEGAGGGTINETIETPLTVEMARYSGDRQKQAVEELVERLLDERNKLLLGELIMDSARELFPKAETDIKSTQEFIDELDLPLAVEFFMGVAKANKKVFDPFLKAIPAKIRSKLPGGVASAEPASN